MGTFCHSTEGKTSQKVQRGGEVQRIVNNHIIDADIKFAPAFPREILVYPVTTSFHVFTFCADTVEHTRTSRMVNSKCS